MSWDGFRWNCPEFFRSAFHYLEAPTVKTVVIGSYWEDYPIRQLLVLDDGSKLPLKRQDARWDIVWNDFEEFVKRLRQMGKDVFIVLPNPTRIQYQGDEKKLRRLTGFARFPDQAEAIDEAAYHRKTSYIRTRLQFIGRKFGVQVLDPAPMMCDGKRCPVYSKEGVLVFKDDDHLRAGYVRRYANFFDAAVLSSSRDP
jgi:hypothetical protein